MEHFLFGKLARYTENVPKIVSVIAHAGVFPVDKADRSVVRNKEVQPEEIVMAEHRSAAILYQQLVELCRLARHVPIVGNIDLATVKRFPFVGLAFFVEAEDRATLALLS